MLREYPALGLFFRYGTYLAVAAGLGVLVACMAAVIGIESGWLWVPLSAGGALATACFLILLRDLVKVVVETLIPTP